MTYTHYLELFNYVLTHGERIEGKIHFNNLTAWHEIDGYTCYLGYQDVTLTLLFHSRLSYVYDNKSSFTAFQNEALKEYNLIQNQRKHNRGLNHE
jgi:mevalonate pyrophosphate decarboxylase